MRSTLIISLVLAVLAVVFALQNPGYIDVQIGPFDLYGSTALILIVTFAVGVLVGILGTIPSRMKSRKHVKELEKTLRAEHEAQLAAAQAELAKMPPPQPPPPSSEPQVPPGDPAHP